MKWKHTTLNEVCDIVGGGTPSKAVKEYYLGELPWVTVRDMKFDFVSGTEFKITQEAVRKSSTNVIKKGNVIIATRVGLGKVCILTKDSAINQDLKGLVPRSNDLIDNKFLFWWYKSISKKIEEAGVGLTVKGVKVDFIKKLPIGIPPLPEQQKIVEKLDAAFELIDRAKANIEQNIQNAKELFQSKLNEVFSQKGEDWEEKKLVQLTTKIGSGATPRGGQKNYKSEGISLVRSMNVHDCFFKKDNLAFIDNNQASELDGVALQKEDVLLNITGASVARCCVINSAFLPARVNQHVSIIRPIQSELNSFFLNYLLISKLYKDKLLKTGSKGATRQAITKAEIENFKILLPKAGTQQKIVAQLDQLSVQTELLQQKYQQKLQNLEELRKSILEKAFKGELI